MSVAEPCTDHEVIKDFVVKLGFEADDAVLGMKKAATALADVSAPAIRLAVVQKFGDTSLALRQPSLFFAMVKSISDFVIDGTVSDFEKLKDDPKAIL